MSDPAGVLDEIGVTITGCRRCPRLVRWREGAALHPPRSLVGSEYWARPGPGFGDPAAWIYVPFLGAELRALTELRVVLALGQFAWWSFTFPVGTCVTGITGLALHTDLPAFRWAAVVAYACLLVAWLTVALRTAIGSLSGRLLLAPAALA